MKVAQSSDLEQYRFITSRRIAAAYRRYEFFGLIVTGPQGIGKSVYALKVLQELYGSWSTMKRYIVFSLEDLINIFETKGRHLCVVWDDAGIHGHKYLVYYSKKLGQLIQGYIDVVRTKLASMIVTVPSHTELMKPIRDSPGFRVARIQRAEGSPDTRAAVVYTRAAVPFRSRWVKSYIDIFNVHMDDAVYSEYMEMRKQFYEDAERRLIRYVRKLAEKLEEMSRDDAGDEDGDGGRVRRRGSVVDALVSSE